MMFVSKCKLMLCSQTAPLTFSFCFFFLLVTFLLACHKVSVFFKLAVHVNSAVSKVIYIFFCGVDTVSRVFHFVFCFFNFQVKSLVPIWSDLEKPN